MNGRVDVLAGELGDQGVEALVVGLDVDGREEGLDVLSGGGGLRDGEEKGQNFRTGDDGEAKDQREGRGRTLPPVVRRR